MPDPVAPAPPRRLLRPARSGALLALVLVLAGCATSAPGRTTPPPWSAPADVAAGVKAAKLSLLTEEGSALHTHQHLSITVDGRAVPVPADLGVDEAARRISAVHTHDTTGIVHVESPVKRTFHLGQVFSEWDVRLERGAIGAYVDGQDDASVAVFVNGKRFGGDPRDIALTEHEDIDVVVVHGGATPHALAAFPWPSGY